jgi:hypothetical protein
MTRPRPAPAAPRRPTPRPGEVARLLARRAAAAGRIDDLRRRVDERKGYPSSKDAASRLLAAIDEAAKE